MILEPDKAVQHKNPEHPLASNPLVFPTGHVQIERLIKDGAFEFQMGLRQGSPEFFQNSSTTRSLLDQRRTQLNKSPLNYFAANTCGLEAAEELISFAKFHNPDLSADSLLSLGKVWEPDFVLLRKNKEEQFRLVAGCVCFPSSWSVPEKIGLTVEAIHAPVPTLNTNFANKIDLFLNRLKPDAMWERWNWGLTASPNLNQHPSCKALPKLDTKSTLDSSWFRAEQQAFCLLPETKSILFAIRIKAVPLIELSANTDLARRLAHQLLSMPQEIAEYKGLESSREHLASLLLGE